MAQYINSTPDGTHYSIVTDDDIRAHVVDTLNQRTVTIEGVQYGYGAILAAIGKIHLNELVNDQIDYALKNGELAEAS